MMRIRLFFVWLSVTAIVFNSCTDSSKDSKEFPDWKNALQQKLPFLGHRNWILIVDKAFPAQSSSGLVTINTGEPLVEVLQYVKKQLDSTPHIKPIIYKDLELQYVGDTLSPGIDVVKNKLKSVLKETETNTILHNDIFKKIDDASKLFSVLILKTEELHPYTSVFIELDCAYWNGDKEERLRQRMQQ